MESNDDIKIEFLVQLNVEYFKYYFLAGYEQLGCKTKFFPAPEEFDESKVYY